jgi:hypothetical protein
MDHPVISAYMGVNSSTLAYACPDLIRPKKILGIRDNLNAKVEFTYDATIGKIVLTVAPATSSAYKVYGLPADVRTNISDVVEAIDEEQEHVLWAYVRAFAHSMKNSAQYIDRLKEADKLSNDARQDANWDLSLVGATVQQVDQRGKRIGETGNADGVVIDISNQFGSDL